MDKVGLAANSERASTVMSYTGLSGEDGEWWNQGRTDPEVPALEN